MTEEYDNIEKDDYEIVFDCSFIHRIREFFGRFLTEFKSIDKRYDSIFFKSAPWRLTEPGSGYSYIFYCDVDSDKMSFTFRVQDSSYYDDVVQAIVFSVKTHAQEIFGERVHVKILKDW